MWHNTLGVVSSVEIHLGEKLIISLIRKIWVIQVKNDHSLCGYRENKLKSITNKPIFILLGIYIIYLLSCYYTEHRSIKMHNCILPFENSFIIITLLPLVKTLLSYCPWRYHKWLLFLIFLVFAFIMNSKFSDFRNMSLVNCNSYTDIPNDWQEILLTNRMKPLPFTVVNSEKHIIFKSWKKYLITNKKNVTLKQGPSKESNFEKNPKH